MSRIRCLFVKQSSGKNAFKFLVFSCQTHSNCERRRQRWTVNKRIARADDKEVCGKIGSRGTLTGNLPHHRRRARELPTIVLVLLLPLPPSFSLFSSSWSMLRQLFIPLLLFASHASAQVTVYATTGTAAAQRPTPCIGAVACDGSPLQPVNAPANGAQFNNQIQAQLFSGGMANLSMQHFGHFAGFSLELSVANHLSKWPFPQVSRSHIYILWCEKSGRTGHISTPSS